MTTITYTPPATMRRFMRSDAFVRACIGPIGSGKSSACIVEIPRRAAQQAPGSDGIRRTRFAVIRNTRPQLQDTTRRTFEQWIPPERGTWNEQDFTFTLEGPLSDGTRLHCEVLFRALDRPQDVRKVLSLELTGAYINEAREIPKEVVDGLQGRVGRYPSKAQGGATWFGIWMDSNPWHTGHWGYELFSKQRPADFALFEQPSGLGADAENLENLPPGYYERLRSGKDAEWIAEYLRGEYPRADKGSVYGALIDALEQRGGVSDFAHPSDGVFASFDLGVSDATAIWWWRIGVHGVPDVIDWYEATGQGAAHYFEVLRSKPYHYEKILLPHDARARTFQTGVSTLELFRKEFPGQVEIGPELSLLDGIGAARWMLEQPIRIHERCADGLKRLRAYKYEWDEDRKVFKKTPLHDWTSHTADGFRYVATAAQAAEFRMRREDPAERRRVAALAAIEKLKKAPTLDELWEGVETPRERV